MVNVFLRLLQAVALLFSGASLIDYATDYLNNQNLVGGEPVGIVLGLVAFFAASVALRLEGVRRARATE